MVYFRSVRKTRHYEEEHEREVPWDRVVELIFTVKNPKRKGSCFEIESGRHYVLFRIENGVLWVINAKRK